MKLSIRRAAPLAVLVVLMGCDRKRTRQEQSGTSTPTLTGAEVGLVSTVTATNRLVQVICAHEARCDNIGSGKRYENSNRCGDHARDEVSGELHEVVCERGVGQKELDACLNAIEAESCTNVLDKVDDLAQCRTSSLCTNPK
jgi:hypothetical protein